MTKALSLRDLRHLRNRSHRELLSFPNAIGTALGQKRRNGALTGERCIVVFVKNKLELDRLRSPDKIPVEVSSSRTSALIDIVNIHSLQRQISSPPYYCHDGEKQGVVTAFARSQDEIFAVTCAHCLDGPDADPYTEDPISLFNTTNQSYIRVGASAYSFQGPGHGAPGNFGFADIGLFTLKEPKIRARALKGAMMDIRTRVRVNDQVYADSAHGRLVGTVDMVEGVFANLYADMVVKIEREGTFGGDSGMLWRSTTGAGLGVHTYGSVGAPGIGSEYSVAMFARRARKFLQVDFIEPT